MPNTLKSAIANFKTQADNWQGASLVMVCSASVALLIGAYAPKGRQEYTKTVEDLKAAVAERGVKVAQIYRYIGLARELVIHLVREHPLLDGPVHDVLAADDPAAGTEALMKALTKDGVKSLDAIATYLGKYQRTRANRSASARRATAPPDVVEARQQVTEIASATEDPALLTDLIDILTKRLVALAQAAHEAEGKTDGKGKPTNGRRTRGVRARQMDAMHA